MKVKVLKDKATMILIIAFIALSVLLLIPYSSREIPQNRAGSLSKKVTKEGNTERTDYMDKNGTITMAADIGYATVIATNEDNRRTEHFYDEKGEPVSRYPGYYALLREYDEQGRNYHTAYLDINDMPVMTKEGYSDKYLTYYEDGKKKTEKYYDPSGNPACTSNYGYGLLNEYDENGRVIKITYLNEKDEPMCTRLGYAIAARNLYNTEGKENGKVESEFYFDEKGEPTALSLGQYGVHKEYDDNGQEAVLTYLDQNGNPIVTSKGYTTVRKTYHANNYTATERYFDLDGKPFSMADGQYGVKRGDNQISYLDQNGKEAFNLRRFLYNHTWVIIPGAILIIVLSAMIDRKWNILLLVVYLAVIAYLTIFFRENGEAKATEFLAYFRKIFTDSEARLDIFRNIWLFIPLGAILYRLYPKKVALFIPIVLSVAIEGIQFFTGKGFCELDDVISNGVGGGIGYLSESLLRKTAGKSVLFFWRKHHEVK